MRVFYSWQLDAPRKTNKTFIHEALKKAITLVEDDLEVSEAEREDIELDQDTQGVLGSPNIARVILEKIATSDLVVADVSLVAKSNENKPHINRNVAIELGFTYGKLGDKSLLKIMNTHFGTPKNLPFDLRTRRHPVQYSLAPNADSGAIASEQKKLANELADILKLYLAKQTPVVEQAPDHVETPSTKMRGVFWHPQDALIPRNPPFVRDDVHWNDLSALYVRFIPQAALPKLTLREATDMTGDLWPLQSSGGFGRSRNKWGGISHCIAQDGDLMGMTQLFKNREIWGVDVYYPSIFTEPEDHDEEPRRYLPSGALQRDYPRAIGSMRKLAAHLDYGDQYTIEMGLSGAEGMRMAIDNRYIESMPGPIFADEVYFRKDVSADYPTGSIMNDFWDVLFSEAGRAVPEELIWIDQT